MAQKIIRFNGGATGAAVTTSTESNIATVALNGGTITYADAAAKSGAVGARLTTVSGQLTIFDVNLAASNTKLGHTCWLKLDATPNVPRPIVVQFRHASGTNSQISWGTLGIVAQTISNGTDRILLSSPSLNAWYKITTLLDATTGAFEFKIYDDTGTLLHTESGTDSGMNTAAFTAVRHGLYSPITNTPTMDWDSVVVEDGATSVPADPLEQLATPTVTLGATTNPTSIGGNDGTQVVTWSAVTNAVSYDAYRANSSSPVQNDFVLIASGVTSPYTFTGLSSGTYAFGIKARA